MKKIVSLSIHRGRFLSCKSDKFLENESFRAFMWNNFIPKHDDILWVAEFSHRNIFELVKEFKRSAKDWSALHGDCSIMGIDDDSPCWPIDSSLVHLPAQELDIETRRQIVHCGGYKGLLGAVRQQSDLSYQIQVYDVLPLPSHEEVAGALVNCSCWSQSIFSAVEQLRIMAQASARRLGILKVTGLDDDEACWPEGFGLRRLN